MNTLGFEKTILASMNDAETRVTEVLKEKGFGILTKIDFACKMKEKLEKDVRPTLILGACNPKLAYEAYTRDANMLLLVPCNVTLEQISANEVKVSMIRPTQMLKSLNRPELVEMAKEADQILDSALQSL